MATYTHAMSVAMLCAGLFTICREEVIVYGMRPTTNVRIRLRATKHRRTSRCWCFLACVEITVFGAWMVGGTGLAGLFAVLGADVSRQPGVRGVLITDGTHWTELVDIFGDDESHVQPGWVNGELQVESDVTSGKGSCDAKSSLLQRFCAERGRVRNLCLCYDFLQNLT